MRILGIDYGTKRIGLAVSDELHMLARELSILAPGDFWKTLPDLIRENEVGEIVVGLPLGMGAQRTQKTEEAEVFAERIRTTTGLPVILMDERLSSQMAGHLPGAGARVDSLAAQIILQNHLNKTSSTL